ARVGAQIQVATPLGGGRAAGIGAHGYLAGVGELARHTRAAPGTGQEDHGGPFSISGRRRPRPSRPPALPRRTAPGRTRRRWPAPTRTRGTAAGLPPTPTPTP